MDQKYYSNFEQTCPDCYSRLCSTVCSFHKFFGDKGEATMITAGNELRANLEQHALVCVCALPCMTLRVVTYYALAYHALISFSSNLLQE